MSTMRMVAVPRLTPEVMEMMEQFKWVTQGHVSLPANEIHCLPALISYTHLKGPAGWKSLRF